MPKELKFNSSARNALLRGVNQLGDAVRLTIGPKGRNAIIDQGLGQPLVTNDGVTIAKSIQLADPVENMGARLVLQAAHNTNEVAGDGTTTATLLTYAMINKGHELLSLGANPVDLREGIEDATKFVVDILNKTSQPITSNDIARVASISAASEEIGDLIAEAIRRVTEKGSITIEESRSSTTEVVVTEGVSYDRPLMTPYFMTSPQEQKGIYEDALVLVTDHTVTHIQQILTLLEEVVETGQPLFIVAEGIENEPLTTLVANAQNGILKVGAMKAPGFGDRKKENLEDIAILTGAKFISADLGLKLSDVTLADLGSAKRVISGKYETIFIEGQAQEGSVQERIELVEALLDEAKTEVDKEKLKERLGKLNGAVAVIKVGGSTEVELKERKLRIEDALNATRAAIEEGILPGGGLALYNISHELQVYIEDELEEYKKQGASIVYNAIQKPIRQIIENAGKTERVLFDLELVQQNCGLGYGYDARRSEYVDMIDNGIIDPVKVTRAALQNSASVAALFLTTDVSIAIQPEPSKGQPDIHVPLGGASQAYL